MPGCSVAWMKRLADFLDDGNWHTVREVSLRFSISENSASANMRKLRTKKFGSHLLESKPDVIDNRVMWFYRLIPNVMRN